jgi:predicted RNA-binding protein (virulence factor B family)
MINIGEKVNLEIVKRVPFGFYLKYHNYEILLPTKYTNDTMKVGDFVDVVIYTDSNDKLIATTLTPKAYAETFASLKVVDVNPTGAFLDLGLEKHILVPKSMQVSNLQIDNNYIFYVYADKLSTRLIATEKLDRFFETNHIDLELNEEVDLLVYKKTPMGYKVVINGMYSGMIYNNEVFSHLKVGYPALGYVKLIREDNKIDISLQPIGVDNLLMAKDSILSKLENNRGILEISDKSDSEKIKSTLNMSKKTFKRALGMLYKEGLVRILEDKIERVNAE